MKVSVILPTYNRVSLLERATASVLGQTEDDLELIVVDDGSTDGTRRFLEDLSRLDGRVRYIAASHQGANAARNAGLAQAVGEHIAFMDSDDEWSDRFLERMLRQVDPGVLAFSSFTRTGLDGSVQVIPHDHVNNPSRMILRGNFVTLQTVLVRRDDIGELRFDEDLRRLQDWDFIIRAVSQRGLRLRHFPMTLVRLHRQSDSISEGRAEVLTSALRAIFRRHGPLFVRDPIALARILRRAWIKPAGARIAEELRVRGLSAKLDSGWLSRGRGRRSWMGLLARSDDEGADPRVLGVDGSE